MELMEVVVVVLDINTKHWYLQDPNILENPNSEAEQCLLLAGMSQIPQ